MGNNQQIIIYKTEDGKIAVDTLMKNESLWLSQKSMALLFDCSVDNVALHLKNIYQTSELNEKATSEDFSVVQKEGNREISHALATTKSELEFNKFKAKKRTIEKAESLKELEKDLKKLNSQQ